MQHIAVMNSGGDSPGMNTAVSAIARSSALRGMPLVGIVRGYNGIIRKDEALLSAFFANAREVVAGNRKEILLLDVVEQAVCGDGTSGGGESEPILPDIRPLLDKYRQRLALADGIDAFLERFPAFRDDMINLSQEVVLDINNMPGAFLRTARCLEFHNPIVRMRSAINLVAAGIRGLVVIGGNGSFRGVSFLSQLGVPCIGIPGTIDNDLAYTEVSLGFDTAVNVCMDSVVNIRSTSRGHDRPHIVEVMGRDCGDIALHTAMTTGAEIVLVSEVPWSIDKTAARLQKLIDAGNMRATIVVAEGAYRSMEPFDAYRYLGPIYEAQNQNRPHEEQRRIWPDERMTARKLGEILKHKCHDPLGKPVEVRATVLGYIQRGAPPTAYDARFAFEAGHLAVKLLSDGDSDVVIGIQNGTVLSFPMETVFDREMNGDVRFNMKTYNLINSL